jgi:hypothetical protein
MTSSINYELQLATYKRLNTELHFFKSINFIYMNKLFRFFMLGALVCSAICCGKDEVEPPVPLVPAFVTVDAADASILLLGDAVSQEITVKANRGIEVTVNDEAKAWLTASVVSDLTAGTAKLTLTVTKNETAFKGRTGTVSLAAIATPDRTDDNVSSSSAKGSLEVKQSLYGLPTADLFDWKADATGNVSDVSPNAMAIEIGPDKPVTSLNPAYGLYEATIRDISSEVYAADHPLYPGNTTYADIAKLKYTAADGNQYEVGSKRMCYYKIPWSNNAGIVNAYKSAFSYEVIYQAPEYSNTNNNLFGNIGPTHCGFGIRRGENVNLFSYFTVWGGDAHHQVRQTNAAGELVKVDFVKYYHVIATYNKNSSTELVALYVDGVKVGASELGDIGKSLHFPRDYYAGVNGHTNEEDEATRTPSTEFLCIGGGPTGSGYPSWGPPHDTKIVVARVYGKALTQAEVSALYNYHKPE